MLEKTRRQVAKPISNKTKWEKYPTNIHKGSAKVFIRGRRYHKDIHELVFSKDACLSPFLHAPHRRSLVQCSRGAVLLETVEGVVQNPFPITPTVSLYSVQ